LSRRARRIVIVIVVALVIAFVVGDRLADQAAERAIALKVRSAALLGDTPSVDIVGFPFLTQAARGRYGEIKVTAHDIRRGGVRIDTIRGDFHGVHVGLGAALAGNVKRVRIDRATGSLLVTTADLNAMLGKQRLSATAQDGQLRVTGRPLVGDARVSATAVYSVDVAGRKLVFTPVPGSIQVAGTTVTGVAATAVSAALTISVDTGTLPFGLQVKSAAVVENGIEVQAAAEGLLVPVPADAAQASDLTSD
jgi:hypothetical protein